MRENAPSECRDAANEICTLRIYLKILYCLWGDVFGGWVEFKNRKFICPHVVYTYVHICAICVCVSGGHDAKAARRQHHVRSVYYDGGNDT